MKKNYPELFSVNDTLSKVNKTRSCYPCVLTSNSNNHKFLAPCCAFPFWAPSWITKNSSVLFGSDTNSGINYGRPVSQNEDPTGANLGLRMIAVAITFCLLLAISLFLFHITRRKRHAFRLRRQQQRNLARQSDLNLSYRQQLWGDIECILLTGTTHPTMGATWLPMHPPPYSLAVQTVPKSPDDPPPSYDASVYGHQLDYQPGHISSPVVISTELEQTSAAPNLNVASESCQLNHILQLDSSNNHSISSPIIAQPIRDNVRIDHPSSTCQYTDYGYIDEGEQRTNSILNNAQVID